MMEQNVPLPFHGIASGLRVTQISASYGHALAMTDKGLVFAWGSNLQGQLGVGDFMHRPEPALLHHFTDEALEPPTELVAGKTSSFAVRSFSLCVHRTRVSMY